MNILQPNRMAAAILTGTDTAQGTSFAIPIVSGVIALVIEANPNLGWWDIQQILAITARKVNDPTTDPVWSGAPHWNGGGMHISHDYGFGDVDARTVNKTVFYVRTVT